MTTTSTPATASTPRPTESGSTAPLDPAALDEPPVATDWIALHIFYSSNSNPMLEECIAPLITRLREEGLIDRWFFIRYWMEGPHLRLRLHPTDPADRAVVLARAEDAAREFIKTRPALYKADPDVLDTLYKDMFLMEYSEADWEEKYGTDGAMPMQESNTLAEYPYEPEYLKYGGPRGIRLAEEHFEHSSDLVVRLVSSTNLHVRNVMFGLALQLMTVSTLTFLPRPEDGATFHDRYQTIWETTMLAQSSPTRDGFEANYQEMAEPLHERLSTVREALESGRPESLPGFLGEWAVHLAQLRDRLVRATEAGDIVLAEHYTEGDRVVASDPQATLYTMLVPFMHMTNNRLGVSIVEEVYLSHLLERYLESLQPDVA